MAYLGFALFAEGTTDHRFFSPLILRLTESILLRLGDKVVDLGEVVELQAPPEFAGARREVQIERAALQSAGAFHILFVHADGTTKPATARAQQAYPGLVAALGSLGHGYAGVAIVPVREMEAWTLADGNALRSAFGSTLDDRTMGIPSRPREVEKLKDPKRTLDQVYSTIVGPGGVNRESAATFLPLLGQTVDLDRLSQVPSFALFASELENALRTLKYIP